MTREEKAKVIAGLTESFSNSQGIVVCDFKGLNVQKLEELRNNAREKNIKFKCYVTADIPEIFGDKFGIERVIINIISNAIKYTGENRKYRYIYRILIQ